MLNEKKILFFFQKYQSEGNETLGHGTRGNETVLARTARTLKIKENKFNFMEKKRQLQCPETWTDLFHCLIASALYNFKSKVIDKIDISFFMEALDNQEITYIFEFFYKFLL